MKIEIDKSKILKLMGERIILSVSKNFRESGRPIKWKPSLRTYQKHRSKRDKKLREGKTLIDTSKLRRSIHFKVNADSVDVGTNIVYAKIHNEGGKLTKSETVRSHKRTITSSKGKRDIMVKSHKRNITINIPERRFLMIQPEDEKYFVKILNKEVRINEGK